MRWNAVAQSFLPSRCHERKLTQLSAAKSKEKEERKGNSPHEEGYNTSALNDSHEGSKQHTHTQKEKGKERQDLSSNHMITRDKTALRGNRKRLSVRSSALFFLHYLCCTSSQFECGVSSEWKRATKLRMASRAFKIQEKKRKSSRLCGPFFPSCLVVITIVITFDSCFLSLFLPLSLFDVCSLENSCFSLTTFFFYDS